MLAVPERRMRDISSLLQPRPGMARRACRTALPSVREPAFDPSLRALSPPSARYPASHAAGPGTARRGAHCGRRRHCRAAARSDRAARVHPWSRAGSVDRCRGRSGGSWPAPALIVRGQPPHVRKPSTSEHARASPRFARRPLGPEAIGAAPSSRRGRARSARKTSRRNSTAGGTRPAVRACGSAPRRASRRRRSARSEPTVPSSRTS